MYSGTKPQTTRI